MGSHSTVLLAGYGTAALLALPFVWLFWRQDVRGNRIMAGLMVGVFVTTVTYTVSLVVDGLAATLSWYYLYLTALSVNAVLFVGLSLVWTDHEEWFRPSVLVPIAVALASVPLVGLVRLVAFGQTFSPLLWADPGVTQLGLLSVFDRQPGPLGLLWRLSATVLVLVALGLLGRFTVRPEQRLYRRQNALMLVGVLSVVLLATAAQLAGVPVEATPIGYLLTATAFTVAITRFGYFDVVPLANDSIIEELGAGVLVYDPGGQILDANGTATEMLGVGCDPGTDVGDVVERAGIVESRADDSQTLSELEATLDDAEFTTTMADERRRVAVSVSAVYGSGDTVLGSRLLLYDVTEQYHREQRLERQNERLDQFASFVSHDLRNPLGIARTYLDFARESGDEDDFAAVEESLERMETMIEDLLTMARADTVVDDTEPVPVDELADDAWSAVHTDGATLTRETADVTVAADPNLLRNVFENIFRNAREHNDGQLTVTVGTLPDSDGFFISDDGSGIPAHRRDKILEQGYSTSEEGSGIGLTIVANIVDAHGWDLHVTEARDGGTRFEFRTGERADVSRNPNP